MPEGIQTLKADEKVMLRLRALYEAYGYKKFAMVKFEEYGFYSRNMDFLRNNRLLTFTGASGRLMALRPDVTMSIVKKTKASAKSCEKLYYLESVYRAEGGASEFTESQQIGVEHIGRVNPYTNIEVITMALSSLDLIQKENILDISHIGFLNGLLSESNAGGETKAKILKAIESKNAGELQLVAEETMEKGQIDSLKKIINLPDDFGQALAVAGSICRNDQMKSAVDELEQLYDAMKKAGRSEKLRLDFSINSDAEYYNGILLRGYVHGVPKAVLSGGRYDLLLSKMGKPGLQAIGFAIYFDELERYLNTLADNEVEAVVLYSEKSDVNLLSAFVDELINQGKRVWTGTEMPEGLLCKKIYVAGESEVKEAAENAE